VWSADTELSDGMTEHSRQVIALSDSLTMSLIIGVDATCMLLRSLTQQLVDAVHLLPCLVTDSLYLPAPPVYCPQPTVTAQVCTVVNVGLWPTNFPCTAIEL